MPSLRDVKRRIGSIKNTAKVTHALEAVSATKMRRWQERALAARPFAAKALALLAYLKSKSGRHYPTLAVKSPKPDAPPTAFIVISSDKGLCGGYNIKLLTYIEKKLKNENNGVKIIALGRYGKDYLKRRNYDILLEETGFGENITQEKVKEMYGFLEHAFLKGIFSKVFVGYTEFITTLRQEPRVRQLLPIDEVDLAAIVENITPRSGRYSEETRNSKLEIPNLRYIFEPSPEAIIPSLVKELTQVALFHMVLEANASEHSARMIAMKNATDNANDILDALGLQYNKARQGEVTKGVLEVAAGASSSH